jgi:hypothetical protein
MWIGSRLHSGAGQSSRAPSTASMPPISVFTTRTPARCQSPVLASASSTNAGVRNTENAA